MSGKVLNPDSQRSSGLPPWTLEIGPRPAFHEFFVMGVGGGIEPVPMFLHPQAEFLYIFYLESRMHIADITGLQSFGNAFRHHIFDQFQKVFAGLRP
jgi:hypothetical protein